MELSSKLPDIGVSIFATMTQLSDAHQAINLSQGFPDFDPLPELKTLVEKYMHQGFNQYAPMPGAPALREKIARKVRALYQADYDPESEITVTSGATEALFVAVTAVARPGDEVILVEPAYDLYAPVVQLSGGVPVYVQLTWPDYRIDWDRVKDAITPSTRLLMLNSPHNPTGATLQASDLDALADILANTGVYVISDEVYEHIIFDGCAHESLCRRPELAARSFIISSFGKTYHTTGWKVGYCLAPADLTREFRKVHQFVTFAVNPFIQLAYAEFMDRTDVYLGVSDFYQKKRDLFLGKLKESRFRPLPCKGTYFQMLDYSEISDEADMDFARRMIRDHGVAAVPPSAFYHKGDDHHVLRFCFAKKDNTLTEAAERLCRI